jgi:hypothetical protein
MFEEYIVFRITLVLSIPTKAETLTLSYVGIETLLYVMHTYRMSISKKIPLLFLQVLEEVVGLREDGHYKN